MPGTRAEVLERPRLIESMELGDRQVLIVSAPAGFGKSILVAQWLERGPASGSVAWTALDPDDDSLNGFWNAFVSGLSHAVGEPLDGLVTDLQSSWTDVRGVVLLPLLERLDGLSEPVTLVLDDLHLISHETALASFDWLLRHLPRSLRLVLVTRKRPRLPSLTKMRLHGTASEITATDLRFTPAETLMLVNQRLGLDLSGSTAEALNRAVDGWPAAVYLAGLAVRRGQTPEHLLTKTTQSTLFDALTAEVLATYDTRMSSFLLRLSVFERFTADLAATVLGADDAAELLLELSRDNLLVIPLDDRGHWLRLHHLLRDLLRDELTRTYPRLARELRLAAGEWFLERGVLREAIDHYLAAEAWDRVVPLLLENIMQLITVGAAELLASYLNAIPDAVKRRDPRLCFIAGHIAVHLGRQTDVLTWLELGRRCARDGELIAGLDWDSIDAFLRGIVPFTDLGTAMRNNERALALLPEDSPYRFVILWASGFIPCMLGDWERGRAGVDAAERALLMTPNPAGEIWLGAVRALVLMGTGDYESAAPVVARSLQIKAEAAFGSDPFSSLALVAAARLSTHTGRAEEALELCRQGLDLVRGWSDPVFMNPSLLIEQARAYAALGHFATAAASLADAERSLDRAIDPGVIPAWLAEVQAMLARVTPRSPGVRPARARDDLTQRELEVLRMLARPIGVKDIASELFVSDNTLKTHIRSVYRKLGVNSREQAVERARQLTLVS